MKVQRSMNVGNRLVIFFFCVKDYGHSDMLDDDIGLLAGMAINIMCKSGKSREPMRRFVFFFFFFFFFGINCCCIHESLSAR